MMSALEQVNALFAEGNIACRSENYEKAVELFDRAITIASEAWGDHGYQLVYPLLGLARAIGRGRGRGIESHPDIAKVLVLEERAIAIAEEYPVIYEQQLSRMLGRLGSTLRLAGRKEEARTCLEKCVSISERVFGDTWDTAHALANLANLLLEMKRPFDALPHLQRAVSVEESLAPKGSHFVNLAFLGRCLLDLNRGEEARPYLEKALAIRVSASGDVDKKMWAVSELGEWISEASKSGDEPH